MTAVVVLAVGVFIAVFDWNWLKGPIERRVQAATGRSFAIAGNLDVDLGLHPRIRANGLELGNAEWSDAPHMLKLERLDMRVDLLPLVRGRVQIHYVSLNSLDVWLERNRQGTGNWVFTSDKPEKQSSARLPLIRDLRITDGKLHVHEPVLQTDLELNVRSGKESPRNEHAPLIADGGGTYRGDPFKLAARVDSPLDFTDKDRPYRIELSASAGETRAHVSGALHGQLQVENIDVHFDLAGPNLADLYTLLGIPLPETPAYSLAGQLQRDGDVWSYRKFKGKVGNSDVAGDASIDLGPQRPMLKAELVSKRLEFKDLAGFVGTRVETSTEGGPLTPTVAADESPEATRNSVSSKPKAQPAVAAADARVLPNTPYKLDKLRVMDADVKLTADSIDAPKLPLEKMSAHLLLDNGVLKLDPLNFDAAGGQIASKITLNARQASIETTATAQVEHLELSKLFPTVHITQRGAGKLSGAIALTAQGNSIAHMAGSSNGDIGLIMGRGHVSNLLVELAGLDVAESLKFLIGKDREIPLRCAYADFKVEDGVMTSRGLAFDTTDTVIYGSGSVNLRREDFNLRLVPQPKDRSPLTVRVPLKIGGSFKDPSFHPEAAPLLARSAAAAVLYTLTPPAALLALIETGPGKNESLDCTKASGKEITETGS